MMLVHVESSIILDAELDHTEGHVDLEVPVKRNVVTELPEPENGESTYISMLG